MLARITYNAPVVLTFSLICFSVLLTDVMTPGLQLRAQVFSAPSVGNFAATSLMTWIRLFTHVFGHVDFSHLTGNLLLILLVGPLLEEKYGSLNLLGMIALTAFVTGLIHGLFMDKSLLGASGVVFMLILLSGFTGFRRGEIPLTFLLLAVIWLSGEMMSIFRDDNVSQAAHIIGGLLGGTIGFVMAGRRTTDS
jgi:membrane associated rhomboid family serine protease